MRALKTKISITLDNDLVDRIKELSEADDRSLSQYINLSLKKHLKNAGLFVSTNHEDDD